MAFPGRRVLSAGHFFGRRFKIRTNVDAIGMSVIIVTDNAGKILETCLLPR
jgi:hypothetical protein